MSNRDRALSPDTPLDELLKLSEQFPDEILQNPLLDLLRSENPEWVSRLSGKAQLALLLSEQCPSWILDSFNIESLELDVIEDLEGGSHIYDFLFEGYKIRLKGETSGKVKRECHLASDYINYFIGALKSDLEARESSRRTPAASALITAGIQQSVIYPDEPDYESDTRDYWPPENPTEIIVYKLKDESEFNISPDMENLKGEKAYRNPSDPRWQDDPQLESRRELAAKFFQIYDQSYGSSLRCIDWLDDESLRRHTWKFEAAKKINLLCKFNDSSKSVRISTKNFLKITRRLALNSTLNTGLLVTLGYHFVMPADLYQILPDELESMTVESFNKLIQKVREQSSSAESLVLDWFMKLGKQIIQNVSNLGVRETNRVEILIHCSEEDRDVFFQEVDTEGSQPWNDCRDPESRYRVTSGQWIPLEKLMSDLQSDMNLRNRFLHSLFYGWEQDIQICLRMPSAFCSVIGHPVRQFQSAFNDFADVYSVSVTQCLPISSEKYLCIEDEIMNPRRRKEPGHQGGYTHRHTSLEGTVWENMGLEQFAVD